MKKALLVFLFFPSVTFSLVEAEIFPWAIIVALLVFCFSEESRSFQRNLLLLLGFIFLNTSLFMFFDGVNDAFRSVAAYVNILSVLWVLRKRFFEVSQLLLISKLLLVGLTVLAMLQLIIGLEFLNPVVETFIPRGTLSPIGLNGGRGFRLLESEPSRAAINYFFIWLIVYDSSSKSMRRWLLFLILFLNALYFKSLAGIVILMLFASYQLLYTLPVMILGLALIVNLPNNIIESNRILNMIQLVSESGSIYDIYFLLMNQSGFRLISLLAAYKIGILKAFGCGIGQWQSSSVFALSLTGYKASNIAYFSEGFGGEWSAIRPNSFLASASLDGGIVFILLFVLLTWRLFASLKIERRLLLSGYFLLLGSVGNPVPWIYLVYSYRRAHGFS